MGVNEKFSWLGSAWESVEAPVLYRSFAQWSYNICMTLSMLWLKIIRGLLLMLKDLYEDSKANYMVQGYWSQDVLRSLYSSSLKLRLKIKCHGSTLDTNKNTSDPQRSSKKAYLGHEEKRLESSKSKSSSIRIRSTPGTAALTVARKQLATQTLIGQQHLIVPGLEIELLSQDSGIRLLVSSRCAQKAS
ncbi:hypothetical protein HPP92_023453 [Vanilla planifolia]|uniref:Uncharacterized protein n=1 Tax=Vanilla planifolia TaxID=51239 RepID=A0A835PTU4_VANPL|nr:hypothetical protein HPP92_023453 [Vanilla planifolia]